MNIIFLIYLESIQAIVCLWHDAIQSEKLRFYSSWNFITALHNIS